MLAAHTQPHFTVVPSRFSTLGNTLSRLSNIGRNRELFNALSDAKSMAIGVIKLDIRYGVYQSLQYNSHLLGLAVMVYA